MQNTQVATRRFPNIHLHGVLVCLAGVVGLYLAGALPSVSPPTDGTIQFLCFGFLFLFGVAGFPALLVKCYADKRPEVAAYALPMIAFIGYGTFRMIPLLTG